MRITSVGGGPAGLYAAILVKAAHPDWTVTVLERNQPDDTFGFGVVFSEATLAELETADPTSHDALVAGCAHWDPVEVRVGGERIRAGGNRFAAISRHRLLAVLQARAREVGVDVRFGVEATGDEPEVAGADLVLAADGVGSRIRSRHEAAFRPRRRVEGSTYIWLATTRRFDAFTFIFTRTDHGLLQAHIYPYADDRSTFIVECDRATLAAAGLAGDDPPLLEDGTDARSVAWLQEVFAADLEGHPLLGNRSRWLDWWTVRNATWRHGNVVLLGDAAHTAHFSIGSGTKLAMEDAIALARALHRHPDLDTALAAYEAARRPAVDAVQQAAADSLAWFAGYHRQWGLPAPQLAYRLLTRSRRIDLANLRRRDPALVDGLTRWYAGGDRATARWRVPLPPALTACRVGPTPLASRVAAVVPPDEAATKGRPSAALADAVAAAAAGGAAMVLVDGIAVTADGRVTPGDARLDADEQVPAWTALVEAARRPGVVLAARLVHAGPRGACRPRALGRDVPLPRAARWPLLAPSARPYGPGSPVPVPLDEADLPTLADAWAAAARRALEAGFDALEVHAGHGYLLGAFLSPLTNRRQDALGGDVAGRLRVPLAVLDAVRAVWPTDRLLSVCVNGSDLQPGGITEDDVVTVARELRAHGADLLHVVSGHTTPDARPTYEPGFNAAWSDVVRLGAGGPVMTGGHLASLDDVDHVLLAGRADLCVLSSPPRQPGWVGRGQER